MSSPSRFHRYTITSKDASKGYFRLVEDPEGAWVAWAEVEANLQVRAASLGDPQAPPCEHCGGSGYIVVLSGTVEIGRTICSWCYNGQSRLRPTDRPTWTCKARPWLATDPPQDCDWPVCGCDPAADKVIEALQESGRLDALATVDPQAPPHTEACRIRMGRGNFGCSCPDPDEIAPQAPEPLQFSIEELSRLKTIDRCIAHSEKTGSKLTNVLSSKQIRFLRWLVERLAGERAASPRAARAEACRVCRKQTHAKWHEAAEGEVNPVALIGYIEALPKSEATRAIVGYVIAVAGIDYKAMKAALESERLEAPRAARPEETK